MKCLVVTRFAPHSALMWMVILSVYFYLVETCSSNQTPPLNPITNFGAKTAPKLVIILMLGV